MTSPPTRPKSSDAASLLPLIGLAVFVLIGVGVTGFMEQRHLQTNGSVSSTMILGEWRAIDKPWRIVFRADRTLSMSTADSSDPVAFKAGGYQFESAGMVSVNMENGKNFTATFREFTPNQFDLVDSEKQAVTVFAKAAP